MPIDMGSIAALTSSLQSVVEIAKVMKGLHDGAAIQAKVIELQAAIMSAQSNALAAQADQFAMLSKVRELEEKVAELENWDAERERYELKAVYPGAFAYVPKPGMQGSEPPHWLCTACFQKREKSILQGFGRDIKEPHVRAYNCPRCSASVRVSYRVGPDRPFVPAPPPEPSPEG
jgi:hypothetical protein